MRYRLKRIYRFLLLGRHGDLMLTALRCSSCGIDWTPQEEHLRCPGCERKTFRVIAPAPLADAGALSRRVHLAFDAYCTRRDRQIARAVAELEAVPTLERAPLTGDHYD